MKHPMWERLTGKSRSFYLLLTLMVLIFVSPLMGKSELTDRIVGLLFSITPVAGIYAVSGERKVRIAALILGIPAFVAIVLHLVAGFELAGGRFFLSIMVVYYGFTTISIIRNLFRRKAVDADTIINAVSAYLLIGLSFGVAYMMLEAGAGGALAESTGDGVVAVSEIFYFSFVTMTTLGYGDVSPLTPAARSLASLQAVCGVLYMSILIARLVADYQSSKG